jgi:choline dehydrogenase-like flavoprotein
MKVVDLNSFESDSVLDVDLCIVGAGPAGLSIANAVAGSGIRVVVLDGGGFEEEPESQALYDIESTGVPRILDQTLLRTRILGGSSHAWYGRCTPFDNSDFARRPWVPFSGWPLTQAEILPYCQRAADYLGLVAVPYDESLWQLFETDPPKPPLSSPALSPRFWQYSRSRRAEGPVHFGRDWVGADDANVEIVLHANATHINLSADGTRFTSVEVSSLRGKRLLVRSHTAVLCCGAIENARLMLASNRVNPAGVGNRNDLVGRFLMDHVTGTAGCIEPSRSSNLRSRFGHYWLDDAQGRHVFLHGLGLSAEIQKEERLLNCHAYVDISDPDEDGPWAALKRLKADVRSGRIAPSDALVALVNLGEIARGFHRRSFRHRPHLGKVTRVEIHLILEQSPDPESRVTLHPRLRDALGMPLSSLHWKTSEMERQTARRMAHLLAQELPKLGLPELRDVPAWETESEWLAASVERAHPTGTTRMASDPKQGVVDPDCQVYGVAGLFVAGSSVFPTTGAANPTLMIVAMALRLADHLKSRIHADRTSAEVSSSALSGSYA